MISKERLRRSTPPGLLTFLFAWQLLVVSCGTAGADPLSLVWRSRAVSSDSLALDFANLYGTLDRLYTLGVRFATKEVKPSGRSLQQVLLDENQYAGSFLAPEVARLLCDLNAKACSFSGLAGEPRWSPSASESIVIPAIDFQSLWTPEYYSAKRGDTIEAIVLRDRRGCIALDFDCRDLLRALNPTKGDVVESPNGRIVVPTRNYFAELKLEGVDLPILSDKSGDVIKELNSLRSSGDETTKRRAEAIFSAVKPVVSNIVAVSGIKRNTATNAPSSGGVNEARAPAYEAALARRKAIFKSIGADGWDPAGGGPYLWVNVALIDSQIDEQHCDFYPDQIRRSITPTVNPKRPDEERGECGMVLVTKPSSIIHGTHVAGIMSAKVGAKIGPGIYPFTFIFSYELDLGDAKVFLQSIAALLQQVLRDRIKVLNVSSRYVKTLGMASDPFEDLMLKGPGPITQQLLVVAAAGNDGLSIGGADQDCPPRPACYNRYRNVISVIAIDDSQMAPAPAVFNAKDSSNSGEHFDIAAPGLKVPSSAPLNQVAELDGTSQAAPIVSGTAAHLYALRPAALPGEIKNRLIWTSDLLPSLYNKVFGGRINVSAALNNFDQDVFRLDDGTNTIGVVLQKDRYTLRLRYKDTNESVAVRLSKIRRMVKRPDGTWDILWLTSDDKDGPLARRQVTLLGMKYRDDEALLELDFITVKQGNQDFEVKLFAKLTDYISSMR